MKAFKTLLTVLVVGTALVGCGKKDSDFKARYAKNASGARAIDPARSEQAIQTAQAHGMTNLDVINIRKQGTNGYQEVYSTVLVNGTAVDIKTSHQGTEEIASQQPSDIAGYKVYINTMCSSANCEMYFIMLTAYKGSTPVMQAGVMKYFPDAAKDTYQWVEAGRFVPFYAQDWYDKSTMIGILLSK